MKQRQIKIRKLIIKTLKKLISSLYPKVENDPKEKYLEIGLIGGLSNKLFCLFSACDIAIKDKYIIVEPYFGWKKRILFSDIYDLNYFNDKMKKYNNGNNIMIPRSQKIFKVLTNKKKIRINNNILWEYSENVLKTQRVNKTMSKDCMNIAVLKALKLNKKYLNIVEKRLVDKDFAAIQVRTESDWVNYATYKVVDEGETLLIDKDKLAEMASEFTSGKKVFFTSGENHELLLRTFNNYGFKTDFFYMPNYEYEINAAINFEICSHAKYFIGLSRSTYSNLISLKRALLDNDNSYIYNHGDKIYRRIDKGLHVRAKYSVAYTTRIY